MTPGPGILQRIAEGNRDAARELIDRYGGLVHALARRFLFDQAEVDDAVQEVFIALWQSAERFNPAIASEETFVAMVARRRLIDRRRRAQRRNQGRVEAEISSMPSENHAPSPEVSEQARRALDLIRTLRPEQQTVLRMSLVQGLSHEQISKLTGMPLGTVKTHVRRGLIALREAMKPLGANTPED
ncbi:MAG: RNA polymerase sigma factor [Phycisphaeraceae bacterium]|nr:RNA polymerase sigma factor [Phycisphaeraceae bacterium]